MIDLRKRYQTRDGREQQMTHEQIERTYDLHTRGWAVRMLDGAARHIANGDLGFQDRCNALAILHDGIINALDHRATGREFRTLRHSWLAHHDPQHHPVVAEKDRRCQECGFPNPIPFQHCYQHWAIELPEQQPDVRALAERCYEASGKGWSGAGEVIAAIERVLAEALGGGQHGTR